MMKSDIEIAQEVNLRKITDVAKELSLSEDDLILFGNYKAKLADAVLEKKNHNGKIILVTAITPTKAGEGKTTVSIGLAQALRRLNKKTCLALREPSLGPVMGLKGGATGGGYSQVLPMEDINFHFTGDMHAITAANNLVSAVIDNELYYDNKLNIDKDRIIWKRCLDVNDRSLRSVNVGCGSKFNGVERPDSFSITVATETMAIFCLSKDMKDLENRLNNALIAYTLDDKPLYIKDLNITGSLLLLLKEAFKPNLVQTVEGGPAIIHGGPFANIAHGCNSVRATTYAKHLADYVVTEAGFGADLGCEKFLDIKSRILGLKPSCVVLVATIRALKMHGGVPLEDLGIENVDSMLKGCENLDRHVNTIKTFGMNCVISINKFYKDSDKEIEALLAYCKAKGYKAELTDIFDKGGEGGISLAKAVLEECDKPLKSIQYLYDENETIKNKIIDISTKAYGAKAVEFSKLAEEKIIEFEKNGYKSLLICMAKTQNSVTDDSKILNAPNDFTIHVKDVSLSLGAGFIVVYTGKILTMPGLPADPACKHMGIDGDGKSYGIF